MTLRDAEWFCALGGVPYSWAPVLVTASERLESFDPPIQIVRARLKDAGCTLSVTAHCGCWAQTLRYSLLMLVQRRDRVAVTIADFIAMMFPMSRAPWQPKWRNSPPDDWRKPTDEQRRRWGTLT